MKNVIKLNMNTVNSVLDLSNFLKKFFNAHVTVMPDGGKDNGIIFIAQFNAMFFIQYSRFQWVSVTVYASGSICVEPVYDVVDIFFLKKKKTRLSNWTSTELKVFLIG